MHVKNVIKKLVRYMYNPKLILTTLAYRGFLHWVSDDAYLKILFEGSMGYKLNLENPQTFNEKLQWLKIHDRKPLYTKLVDKYEVKEYVAEKIGQEHVIPTLGVYNHFSEIDFDAFPQRFALKCTHDSGSVIVCRDKKAFNFEMAKHKLQKSLNKNYYWAGREWPYKNVKPKIIAEPYLDDLVGVDNNNALLNNTPPRLYS